MVLYIIYNANPIEIPASQEEYALSYMDDATFLAIGNTFDNTTKILRDIMLQRGGGLKWSKSHNSKFEISKLAVLHFTTKKS